MRGTRGTRQCQRFARWFDHHTDRLVSNGVLVLIFVLAGVGWPRVESVLRQGAAQRDWPMTLFLWAVALVVLFGIVAFLSYLQEIAVEVRTKSRFALMSDVESKLATQKAAVLSEVESKLGDQGATVAARLQLNDEQVVSLQKRVDQLERPWWRRGVRCAR